MWFRICLTLIVFCLAATADENKRFIEAAQKLGFKVEKGVPKQISFAFAAIPLPTPKRETTIARGVYKDTETKIIYSKKKTELVVAFRTIEPQYLDLEVEYQGWSLRSDDDWILVYQLNRKVSDETLGTYLQQAHETLTSYLTQ